MNHNSFEMEDYGKDENEKKYGQPTPPQYDPSKMRVPVGLFWSATDWLADQVDVEWLASLLPNIALYKRYDQYSHLGLGFLLFYTCN